MPDQAALEIGQGPAFAEHHREILGLAALEGFATDLAEVIDMHTVAILRGALRIAVSGRAACAGHPGCGRYRHRRLRSPDG
jgi:hypothetical protein